MCFCSSCNDSSSYSWNENIIESIFIAVANALVQKKGHLEIIHSELAQLWQYHSDFILPFIITRRTVKNHMLSALNFGEQGLPRLTQTNVKQPNPWYTVPFPIIYRHPPPTFSTFLSLTRRWVEPSGEGKVNNIQNKSTCSTSPWMTSASAPPTHRAINSFVFFFCFFFQVCFRCEQTDK